MSKLKGYDLTKLWWQFATVYDGVRPAHSALYFFATHLYNTLQHPNEFGLPTYDTMQVLGIANYKTYAKVLADLSDWNFIRIVKKSKNQHQASVVALVKNTKADIEATIEAITKANAEAHENEGCFGKKYQSTVQGTVAITKLIKTNKNYVNNKLRVGLDFFDLTPWDYFQQHHAITLEQFKITHKQADFKQLAQRLNTDYLATGFNNELHAKNAVKAILTDLIKQQSHEHSQHHQPSNKRSQSIGTGTVKTFNDGFTKGS